MSSRSAILRGLLSEGPTTCHEVAATTGLTLRRARVAMWVLTHAGHARISAMVPVEGKGAHRRIYELTPQGKVALREDRRKAK